MGGLQIKSKVCTWLVLKKRRKKSFPHGTHDVCLQIEEKNNEYKPREAEYQSDA